ncbi:MAG TPA: hypothetical protein VN223_02790 [Candidatus Elarobacter sp.]|nr:hypothetical protein [Candidatus Elarobacter sp.]
MKIIPDQLRSRNLVPFKKRQGKYNIPGMARENPISMDRVDTGLSPEEQGYIRHYLVYADALLRSAEDNVPPKAQEDKFQLTEMAIEERPTEKQTREEKLAEVPAEEGREGPVLCKEGSAKEAA